MAIQQVQLEALPRQPHELAEYVVEQALHYHGRVSTSSLTQPLTLLLPAVNNKAYAHTQKNPPALQLHSNPSAQQRRYRSLGDTHIKQF